jgi:zinc/manganese transport system permease protein
LSLEPRVEGEGALFSGFMVNAWIVASIVAVVAGVVGFFIVLRGSAFAAHAIPNGSFAGAAGATLIGVNTLVGLGVFSLLGALGIGWLGRRGRQDVVTALALVLMLALGSLFLSFSSEYEPAVYSLLFGEVLGISPTELVPTAVLAAASVLAIALIYRPLLLSSVLPEVGAARGVSAFAMELCFLLVLALATTMTVPVVGTLLIFSLMIGPPAAARSFTSRPLIAMALSVAIALLTVWAAIALSYKTNYPIGFFVGSISAASYAVGRTWSAIGKPGGAAPVSATAALSS